MRNGLIRRKTECKGTARKNLSPSLKERREGGGEWDDLQQDQRDQQEGNGMCRADSFERRSQPREQNEDTEEQNRQLSYTEKRSRGTAEGQHRNPYRDPESCFSDSKHNLL